MLATPLTSPARHTLDVEHQACMRRIADGRSRAVAERHVPPGKRCGSPAADRLVAIRERQQRLDRLRKLSDLEARGDEMGYMLNVGKILMKYYDVHGVDRAAEEPRVRDVPTGSILSYFVAPVSRDDRVDALAARRDAPETKAELVDEYMRVVRGAAPGGAAAGGARCGCCGSSRMVVHALESQAVCGDCDASEHVLVDNERPGREGAGGGGGGRDQCAYNFKRQSHFGEWLAQIQGKENTLVPDEVYAAVLAEFRKQQVANLVSVTPKQIRAILKKNGHAKYYEHATSILHHLNGTPAMSISPALEEKLRSMFKQIQIPFMNHTPPGRKNFLSYSYVLHKFVELLGEDEYLGKFRLLKSRDKLCVQETVWAKICGELGWQVIPSI